MNINIYVAALIYQARLQLTKKYGWKLIFPRITLERPRHYQRNITMKKERQTHPYSGHIQDTTSRAPYIFKYVMFRIN